MRHPKNYWKDRENMMREARKYSTKEEFQKGNLSAFLAAYRYGYIDDMDWLVKQKQHKKKYWTYDHIEEEALKYNTKTEFFKGSQTAYRAALKMGVIDDFFACLSEAEGRIDVFGGVELDDVARRRVFHVKRRSQVRGNTSVLLRCFVERCAHPRYE